MQHVVTAKTVVGSGEGTVLLEVRGGVVRLKRRGAPDLFLPLESAGEVGRFLLAAAARRDRPSGRDPDGAAARA